MGVIEDRLRKTRPDVAAALDKNERKRSLALALRKMRKAAGLTQTELAERSGLRQDHISKIEAPTGPLPAMKTIISYAEGCGMTAHLSFLDAAAAGEAPPARKTPEPVAEASLA